MAKPLKEVWLIPLKMAFPDRRPFFAPSRIGRKCISDDHGGAVVADVVVEAKQAAPIMAVIGVTIIGEEERDDAFQVRRREAGWIALRA